LCPASKRVQDTSVPQPKGDTMPVPVITTRLIARRPPSFYDDMRISLLRPASPDEIGRTLQPAPSKSAKD